jgi:hypothetical protein
MLAQGRRIERTEVTLERRLPTCFWWENGFREAGDGDGLRKFPADVHPPFSAVFVCTKEARTN